MATIPAENLTDFNRIARYSEGKAAQVEAVGVDRANGIVTVIVKPHGKFGTEPVVFRVGEMVEVA